MNVHEDLNDLERALEERAREAKRLLALGRTEALQELHGERAKLGAAYENVLKALNRLAAQADARVEGVLDRLARMNYLIAEEAIDTPEAIAGLGQEVVREIDAALEGLDAIEEDKRRGWDREGGDLRQAWERFRSRLELARLHLEKERDDAEAAFATERQQLIAELAKVGEPDFRTRMREGWSTLAPWLQALLMMPEVASPTPPDEEDTDADASA